MAESEPAFQWLGTAGFRIEYSDRVILIDPYLTRNPAAEPVQDLTCEDLADADMIFVTHGHFDHLADVPGIARLSGALVYCSAVSARTLEKKGVNPSGIVTLTGGERLDLGDFGVSVEKSRHTRFDARLLMETVPDVLKEAGSVLPELAGMPAGPVLLYQFDFDGLTVTDMGSMGITAGQVTAKGLAPTDLLFIPVQGHTDICHMAAEVTVALSPRGVVPQHWDDFYPPVSRMIDVEPFREEVGRRLPGCGYHKPEINSVFWYADVTGEKTGQ